MEVERRIYTVASRAEDHSFEVTSKVSHASTNSTHPPRRHRTKLCLTNNCLSLDLIPSLAHVSRPYSASPTAISITPNAIRDMYLHPASCSPPLGVTSEHALLIATVPYERWAVPARVMRIAWSGLARSFIRGSRRHWARVRWLLASEDHHMLSDFPRHLKHPVLHVSDLL